MRLTKDDALKLVEERFGQQVAPVMELVSPDHQLAVAILETLRERLMLAENALGRAGNWVIVAEGMPPLPEVWVAVRMHLSPGEVVEWERLNKVVIDLMNRIETQSTAGRP